MAEQANHLTRNRVSDERKAADLADLLQPRMIHANSATNRLDLGPTSVHGALR